MKKKIFSTLFALVLVLTLGLVTAVPAGAQSSYPGLKFQVQDISSPAVGTASWVEDTHTGNYAVHLSTGEPDELEAVDSARVVLPYNQALSTVTEVGYSYKLIDGRPANDSAPYIYFELDTDADEDADTWVIHHMFVTAAEDQWGTWLLSTDPVDPAWHAAGTKTTGTPYTDWAAVKAVFDDDTVLNIKIAVGEWNSDHLESHHVDDFQLNGVTYDLEQPAAVWVDDTGDDVNPGTETEPFATIQHAIDILADGTVNVAAGIYDEQVVIDKALTLQGAGDTTVIQPAGPELTATASIPWLSATTKAMSAIVSVETTGDEVTIKDLKIDASLITSKSTLWVGGLVYLETSGKVEGLTVTINSALPDRTAGIFAAAIINASLVEVTECNVIGYNRAGIYALGAEFTADYHHNEINGPGVLSTGVPNGMFFLEDANGSATYNTVTDLFYTGEQYRSTGIGTYNAGTDVTFAYNTISKVQNAFALANGTSGTIVEHNTVYDCHTGVRLESGATNSVIRYNDIHDNDFAIRCESETVSGPAAVKGMGAGNVAHYNDFVNNPGLAWINIEGNAKLEYTYEGAVCNLSTTNSLDADFNWWGDVAGPDTLGGTAPHNPYTDWTEGDAVSDGVDYLPWLIRIDLVVENDGWNIVSLPIVGEEGDSEPIEGIAIYHFDSSTQKWGFPPYEPGHEPNPLDAYYVKVIAPISFIYPVSSEATFPSQKAMKVGWNFVGLAELYDMAVDEAVSDALWGTGEAELVGYNKVISPSLNGASWTYLRDSGTGPDMLTTKGYWVFMVNDGVLGGFSSTPIVEGVPIPGPGP